MKRRTKRQIRWDKWMIYGIVAVLAILTCKYMYLNYNANDDVEMEGILSGMYTGTPDGHAIYIQALLSYPLSWLYRLFPSVNWYGIVLVGLQWLSLGLVADRADDCMHDVVNRALAMVDIFLIFFIAVWENYVSLTFTTTAGILLAAALFWYVAGDDSPHTQIVTALLVLTGICIRLEFAPVVLFMGGVCWLLKVYRSGIRRVWLLPAVLGSGLILMFVCNGLAYSSQEWKAFLSYSDVRSLVYDYTGVPSYEEDRAFYDENGISVNVFEALDIYDLSSRPETTKELLQKAADYQQKKNQVSFRENIFLTMKESLVSFFEDQYGQTLSPVNILMTAVWFGFILACLRNRKYACLLAGDAALLGMCAMWFYLIWSGRFPYRVLFTMQLLLIAAGAGLWQYGGKNLIPGRMTRRVLLAVLLAVLLIPAFGTWPKCHAHSMEAKATNEDRAVLEDYFAEHPEQFYLLTTPLVASISDSISLEMNEHPMNYADLGGWIVGSPLYRERLALYGITDIRKMLLEGKGCVVTSGRTMDYMFSDEYVEGVDIEYRCVEELHGEKWKYYIYQYILL